MEERSNGVNEQRRRKLSAEGKENKKALILLSANNSACFCDY